MELSQITKVLEDDEEAATYLVDNFRDVQLIDNANRADAQATSAYSRTFRGYSDKLATSERFFAIKVFLGQRISSMDAIKKSQGIVEPFNRMTIKKGAK